MIIEKDKMVSVTYDLKLGNKNSETFETADLEKPLKFKFGSGMLLPAFESALADKKVGDNFEVEISAKDGYGEKDEFMVVDVPKSAFIIDGKIDEEIVSIGNTLPMMSSSGYPMNGLILSIDEENVVMDFNHPLAGENLYFVGQIIDVRDATEEDCCDNGEGCEGCGDGCEHNH